MYLNSSNSTANNTIAVRFNKHKNRRVMIHFVFQYLPYVLITTVITLYNLYKAEYDL